MALSFLYNFHRKHNLLELKIKKLSPKINVKNIKNRVFNVYFGNSEDPDEMPHSAAFHQSHHCFQKKRS